MSGTPPPSPAPVAVGSGRRTIRQRGVHGGDAEHEEGSSERWLLTYADMITLLLVLFIVLFALSKINEAKYRQFQESVTHTRLVGTSIVNGTTTVPSDGPKPLSPSRDNLQKIEQALKSALKQKKLLNDVDFTINSSGLVEGLVADSTLFATDSAQLTQLGIQIVDTSGGVIKRYTNAIVVAGYTDNEPITGGPYANNWELAAARSTSVVVRLTTADNVNPTRVVAVGYGQYHPVVPNNSPAAQAQNRRVNIVVSPEATNPVLSES
ncbi:MAG: flagellar motor protein MotB [Acidimicrobiales bacterium]|jgi:chemotaxis protein MotB